MATFQLSPGVSITEADLSNIIPAVATSIGGAVGKFQWGPVNEPTLISSEAQLLSIFAGPLRDRSRVDWYGAANFLSYSNTLQLVRVNARGALNASGEGLGYNIQNYNDFIDKKSGLIATTGGSTYARYPGLFGNGIGLVLIDASISDSDFRGTVLFGGNRAVDLFGTKPGTSIWAQTQGWTSLKDEVHAVVYTTNNVPTGQTYQVLETYAFLSKAKNGLDANGQPNFYADVINAQSSWVYNVGESNATGYMPAPMGVYGIDLAVTGANATSVMQSFMPRKDSEVLMQLITGVRSYDCAGGFLGTDTDSDAGGYTAAWALLADPQQIDVGLLITNNPLDSTTTTSIATKTIQKYVVDNVANYRKDCVAFVSPGYDASVNTPNAASVTAYFNNNESAFASTSYAFFDSGWKQQYDRYNDEYFWMPLSADMAGLSANASAVAADWYSPAGYNRGFVKNVVKLSFNPNKADRDALYQGRVNPVITERGQGTLLLGDKTALTRPSSFDRINVRRLFIVLEKAIATAAKYQLFEFNDEFTRANFVAQVEPFLQDIQSRRGLTNFLVKCDTSNNTPAVVSSNRFVADIYIRPNYSINFIQLNFVAVGPNVSFSEVAGQ